MSERLAERPEPAIASGARPEFAQAPVFEGVELRELVRVLWRRRSLILGTVALFTAMSLIFVFQVTPLYSTQAQILIEPRESNVADLEAVLTGLPADSESIQSQIEVLRSRQLLGRLVERLEMDRAPEFNESLKPRGFVAQYLDPRGYLPAEWANVLAGNARNAPLSAEDLRIQARARVVDAVLGRLDVSRRGRSRVISVGFTSESSRMAARVANTVAELYLIDQLEARLEATRRATNWLDDQVSELRERVDSSERAVERFRAEMGLISGQEGSFTAQQASELNAQLIVATTARVVAEARLSQVEDRQAFADGVESLAEVLDSPTIQALRQEEAGVQRNVAELFQEFGERHPRMIQARAEAESVAARISDEVDKIVAELRNEVAIAITRESTLRQRVEEMKEEVARDNAATIQLRALEREANSNRVLLETLLSRFRETSAQEDEDIQHPNARIISLASIPAAPSFPNKRLIVGMTLFGAALLGVLLAFAVEQLDKGFRSGEQVERAAGVPVLGLVPVIARRPRLGATPVEDVIERPASAFSESLRTLHTSLRVLNVDNPPKTVLITSAVPGEGKSTLTLCLARMLAMSGHKAVAVCADLRRPQFDMLRNLGPAPGIVDILGGGAQLADALQQDKDSAAFILNAGSGAQNPPNLLGSRKMKELLETLRESFDYVLLDSPPVLAVSDARVLSFAADTTLFVIRWAHTRRESAIEGIRQIRSSGGDLAGVVLSRVNPKKHAGYGYGDSGYYYGRVTKYYSETASRTAP